MVAPRLVDMTYTPDELREIAAEVAAAFREYAALLDDIEAVEDGAA